MTAISPQLILLAHQQSSGDQNGYSGVAADI